MFIAAGPYFQMRFSTSPWLLTNFQPAILTISTITNMIGILVLTKLQKNASYPKRVNVALVMNTAVFVLLALSTILFLDIGPNAYFAFLLFTVFVSNIATAASQNGSLAVVSGFGLGKYTQGLMVGQAIAGVLPCVVQIVAVLSVPAERATHSSASSGGLEGSRSAFAYFMTSTGVTLTTFFAFAYLERRKDRYHRVGAVVDAMDEADDGLQPNRATVGLWTLFRKLKWFALGVIITFAATMVFPVFAQKILSVRPEDSAPRLFQPECFIPLAVLVWNVGDLLGRMMPLIPGFSLVKAPRTVFLISIARLGFIPLYLLCNIRDRGAVIRSDAFYLVVVQLLFGVSNGYLGSTCMMAAPEWVATEEREVAGGFMGLCMVLGLSVGSLLSFLAS